MTDILEFVILETPQRVSNNGSISVVRWQREKRTYCVGPFTNNYYPSVHRGRDQPGTSVTYFNVPVSETFKAEHLVRTLQTVHTTPAVILHVNPETRLCEALVLCNFLQTLQENSGNAPQIRKDSLLHHPFQFTH